MPKKPRVRSDIVRMPYQPPGQYRFDVEIFSMRELRRRAGANLRSAERIEFHLLLYVTAGECKHSVDFESIQCRAGSLLMLRPGQVQRYDARADWQGWLIIFRPELLQSKETGLPLAEVDTLPTHLTLRASERKTFAQSILRMFQDTHLPSSPAMLQALLCHQLHALLLRLCLIHARGSQVNTVTSVSKQRFHRFRLAVEQGFRYQHQVAHYAKHLGYSEKSLTRAVQESSAMNAKAYLSQRIALEAKRLLAHTDLAIAIVADKLGFAEATNFVKFFRRETGCLPGDFRRQHRV